MFKFNIGTAVNGVDNTLKAQDVFLSLQSVGFGGVRIVGVKPSDTETTLIVEADSLPLQSLNHKGAVYVLCQALNQDAIAYTLNDAGYLVGPKAADWGGEFNPEYFLN